MFRLLAVTPDPAQLVVMRTHPSTSASLLPTTATIHQYDHSRELLLLREELGTLRGRAEDAERAKDSFRSDNLRLTHRISYLEEQVAELLQRMKDEETLSHSNGVTQSPLTSSSSVLSNGRVNGVRSITPTKTSTGKADVQVFQKGPQVTALIANLPGLEVGNSSPAESRHSLPTLRPKPNAPYSSSGGTMHHYTITKNPDARSTKSLDFGSDCSSSGGMNHHHRQEKHSHHHHHLQNARSTNSLDMNKSEGTSTLQPKTKHHSHHRLYEATRIAKPGEQCVYDYNSETSSGIDHSKRYQRKHLEGHQQSESHQLLPDMKSKPNCTSESSSGTKRINNLHDVRSVKSLDVDSETSSRHQHHTHHPSHSHSENNHDTQSTRSLDYGSEPTSHTTFRSYKKHHNYHNGNSSCTESKLQRPTPPKKPLRLSLHRATSLQSVSATPPTTPTPADCIQGSKKPTKRNHKGEAPPTPTVIQIAKESPQPPPRTPSRAESCQSALRWPSPAAALHQAVILKTARSGTHLLGHSNEKWC